MNTSYQTTVKLNTRMKRRSTYQEIIQDAIWLKRHVSKSTLNAMDYEKWLESHGWTVKDFEFNQNFRKDLATKAHQRRLWDSIFSSFFRDDDDE